MNEMDDKKKPLDNFFKEIKLFSPPGRKGLIYWIKGN